MILTDVGEKINDKKRYNENNGIYESDNCQIFFLTNPLSLNMIDRVCCFQDHGTHGF
jgi:hypothetical protein